MLAKLLSLSLLLAAPLAALANPHGLYHKRHVEIAKRQTGEVQLHKRFSNAKMTYYDVGLGACGIVNVASDFIVALNSPQFGHGYPGPNCFKGITISYNGKNAFATITDECPGCPEGGLDLSRSLFQFFAAESVGIIYATWSFNDGAPASAPALPAPPKVNKEPPPPPPKPTTTWSPPPPPPTSTWTPPTSTWTPPTSTWTPPPPPPSTSTSSTSIWKLEVPSIIWTPEPTTSSTSASSPSSSGVTSSSVVSSSTAPVPSTTSVPALVPSSTPETQNIHILEQALLQIGFLFVVAAE